jgi:hypothetical protein
MASGRNGHQRTLTGEALNGNFRPEIHAELTTQLRG